MLTINNLVDYDSSKSDQSLSNQYIFKYLGADVSSEKLVASNFGRIKHLNGSRLIDNNDTYMDSEAQHKFTTKLRNPRDIVHISEKLDGMNAGLIKLKGNWYPINRKGYDVRFQLINDKGEINWLFFTWSYWCNKFISRFYDRNRMIHRCTNPLLNDLPDGSRLVFEHCMLIHSLTYHFKNIKDDPVFLLAVYRGNDKVPMSSVGAYASLLGLNTPPLLNVGMAMPPERVIDQYPKGLSGCKDKSGMEGIVYVYERYDKSTNAMLIESTAKYVSNTVAGTNKQYPTYFNTWDNRQEYVDLKHQIQMATNKT